MNEIQTILKMIEEVDPADTAKLDEIDARVWCWLNGYIYIPHNYSDTWNYRYKPDEKFEGYICGSLGTGEDAQKYTRSRDALKAIRPDGWLMNEIFEYKEVASLGTRHSWHVGLIKKFPEEAVESPGLMPTEELAELHAIIQAIEWERTHA